METLMLVNPKARRKSHKPRSAAQRAATKRMIAANRRGRSSNPRKRHARRANPIAARRHHYRARRSNPVRALRHHRRARRHNPIVSGGMGQMLKNAFTGALGVVTVNAAYNYLPLPATLKTPGYTSYAVKGALAVGVGLLGKRFLGARAIKMAEGSLTVTLAQVLSDLATKAGVNLSGVSYYSPAVQFANPRLSEYMQPAGGMGMYMSGNPAFSDPYASEVGY